MELPAAEEEAKGRAEGEQLRVVLEVVVVTKVQGEVKVALGGLQMEVEGSTGEAGQGQQLGAGAQGEHI